LLLLLVSYSLGSAFAQQAPPQTLTLDAAVDLAEVNYPAIRVAKAQAQAANEENRLSTDSILAATRSVVAENRASTNNIFGALLPQAIIPPISGPVLGTKSLSTSTFGSAGGALLSWEPFDFWSAKANVNVLGLLPDKRMRRSVSPN